MWRLITWKTRKRQAEQERAQEVARRRQQFEHNAAVRRIIDQARHR